jgi:hypothetical protein
MSRLVSRLTTAGGIAALLVALSVGTVWRPGPLP